MNEFFLRCSLELSKGLFLVGYFGLSLVWFGVFLLGFFFCFVFAFGLVVRGFFVLFCSGFFCFFGFFLFRFG